MKGYDALECTLISLGFAGKKHLGHLSELSFLTDKVERFLFEFHADDYKSWDYLRSLSLQAAGPFTKY